MKTASIEVTLLDSCGSDLSVVNAARVSFAKESELEYEIVEGSADYEGGGRLSMGDRKLINYLARHKHFSPFNHSFLTFRVKAPIFVARQLVKHKFMPWNEVSRRYVDDEPEFYFPSKWRAKAIDKKQGSGDEHSLSEHWEQLCNDNVFESVTLYQSMIDDGVCPEQARMVLPQNTMTEWIWSGTLGAFCDMLRLRLDSHTQEETRLVAQHIAVWVANMFPVSYNALVGVGND